ncbi:MAG: precorrin-6Y C5,15-methyltransferase (decarboxylating) subunit CbiT [Peptococcaceae bacterium]|jgi:precorrin-6Y C5,15-methyltransferase (decarboxylating) CbiT subunit|nr:precorrin-6Y C5,15-methyltransferase (decarboxylating) subunit CbiT [Peptococcaceae bacterium]MDH7525790.1 precorrin-6Y C5,15-methyltransferase (decarboxylating) subunit CbiT [Peptococcaceae bacterium]
MMINKRSYTVPGIPDRLFLRGNVPMTKEEVRVLCLSKMGVGPGGVFLDIGAGTGSISVECALLAPGGKVIAVEKEGRAVELIEKNCERFGVSNVRVIQGEAPSCLEGLPPADGVVIGGSGGKLEAIVDRSAGLLKPGGRLVINAVLLETAQAGLGFMKKAGLTWVEVTFAALARGRELGGGTALEPLNPVFLVRGIKPCGRKER